MPVRGLTIIVATADRERFALALALASSNAALGGAALVYAHGAAVTLLDGSPAITEALALGVRIVACQTALAEHGLPIPDYAEGGGPVSLLAGLGDDRLVTL